MCLYVLYVDCMSVSFNFFASILNYYRAYQLLRKFSYSRYRIRKIHKDVKNSSFFTYTQIFVLNWFLTVNQYDQTGLGVTNVCTICL